MNAFERAYRIQGWCPLCAGSGMVMEFGPTDCPNIDDHRWLANLAHQPHEDKETNPT